MPILQTFIKPESVAYQENLAAMTALADDLRRHVAITAAGGDAPAVAKHLERGKMLAGDRIDQLIDPGSPFLELSQLAAHGVYGEAVPAAGIVTGIGAIQEQPCMIVANDATVKGGTYYPLTVKKHLRAQEIARENRLLCFY
jgi:3-methylcrotonyl-CoA carboxylase beta subunit